MEDFPEDPFTFPTTCPESFFDASLDAMDVFGKDLFFCPPSMSGDSAAEQHMGTMESLELESFLHSAMGEQSILSDRPKDNSSLQSNQDISATDIHTDQSFDPVSSFLADFDRLRKKHPSSADKQCDVKPEKTELAGVVIKQEKVEVEDGTSTDINRSLEAVEFDIAKLKKEVDFAYDDENSMWSDFFSEEDPSEISREYDDLLQSLLSTPVNDIDVSLNVFNHVDTEPEEQQQVGGQGGAVCVIKLDEEEDEQQMILNSIQSDHCYTLLQQPPPTSSSLLTPPPSSDESDRDDEYGLESCLGAKPALIQEKKIDIDFYCYYVFFFYYYSLTVSVAGRFLWEFGCIYDQKLPVQKRLGENLY
jgi:hypothetical protein